jgi:hypothetical protein
VVEEMPEEQGEVEVETMRNETCVICLIALKYKPVNNSNNALTS